MPIFTKPQIALTLTDTVLTTAYQTGTAFKLDGAKTLTLFCKYTRGAAGLNLDIAVDFSQDAGTTFFQQATVAAGTITAGADTAALIQRYNVRYQATGASAELFFFQVTSVGTFADDATTQVRVKALESGASGGKLQVWAVLS